MNYQFSDGWIFRSIHLTEGSDGIRLDEMIGTADYINKSIPNTDEINHACTKLIALKFLKIEDKKLLITNKGMRFIENIKWDFNRSQHPYEFASEVANKLEKEKSSEDVVVEHFTKSEVKDAFDKYNKAMSKLLAKAFNSDNH